MANQSGYAIEIITQTCKVIEKVYQKYIRPSARLGYTPPVWKRTLVQLKEFRLTIRGDEDKGLFSSEEVWTSPVI